MPAMTTLTSSESNEWYTPPELIALVRDVLGPIDLDPASCATANAIIGARHFYTKEQDGFHYTWNARNVFLNTPFGKSKNQSLAGLWIARMAEQFQANVFQQGIALTHSRPGYEWWETLTRLYPVCLTRKKFDFIPADPKQKTSGSKTSQTLFYFGPDPQRFARILSPIGRILWPERLTDKGASCQNPQHESSRNDAQKSEAST